MASRRASCGEPACCGAVCDDDLVAPSVAVVGGILLALVGRHAYVHADDRRDMSGGAGSWMTPSTRRLWAATIAVLGLVVAAVGAVGWTAP
jgi:hypothetical protein